MFGQTAFGFNFIINADCKKRMLEIQQFSELSKHPKPSNVLQSDIYTYFISILGYNIII
jgi:hypothetical protein